MTVFIVVATKNPRAVGTNLAAKGVAFLEVKHDTWLVSADETTKQLAETLGIRDGSAGPGIVCMISSYSGRLPKDVWEWIRLHEEDDG